MYLLTRQGRDVYPYRTGIGMIQHVLTPIHTYARNLSVSSNIHNFCILSAGFQLT